MQGSGAVPWRWRRGAQGHHPGRRLPPGPPRWPSPLPPLPRSCSCPPVVAACLQPQVLVTARSESESCHDSGSTCDTHPLPASACARCLLTLATTASTGIDRSQPSSWSAGRRLLQLMNTWCTAAVVGHIWREQAGRTHLSPGWPRRCSEPPRCRGARRSAATPPHWSVPRGRLAPLPPSSASPYVRPAQAGGDC